MIFWYYAFLCSQCALLAIPVVITGKKGNETGFWL